MLERARSLCASAKTGTLRACGEPGSCNGLRLENDVRVALSRAGERLETTNLRRRWALLSVSP
jgi:hypothetical protein